ncbi:NERD domain-containing protein [Nocardia beijingensis]|uniref:NERD domain-containing protein n=1 Tax=Nocardia beijingensis TaxID=95162 RepID=UPI0018956F56|nr:NERD domain-containing protein [Nocardia beijingensis]MBF6466390.1 NERD domain-containing protein [Nocardia beijingensis]
MLVINERTTAPRSEQRVLDWMRTWNGQYVIVGLAISGCYLPDRERKDETQEADLVVITPRAAVVVEVKGTVPEAASGVLSVQANGRWRLSGYAGDPIHVRDHDSSPFDQVTNNVFNLKALVRKHNAEAFVDGLIVVVPPKDSNLTLNIESRRRGCAVVLGAGQADLRAWFHRTASRKLIWTAERTHALLTDLNLGDQVTVDDLAADGFPPEQKLRAGTLAALESVTRKTPELEDRTSAEAVDGSADTDASPVGAVPEPSDAVPDAARVTTSTPAAGKPDEVDHQDSEEDRRVTLSAPERTDAADAETGERAGSKSVPPTWSGAGAGTGECAGSEVVSPTWAGAGAGTGERAGSESVPQTWSGAERASQVDRSSPTAPQPLENAAVPDGGHDAFQSHPSEVPVAPAGTQPAESDPFAPELLAPEPPPMPASSDATAHSYAGEGEHQSASARADAEPDVPEDHHPEPPRFEGRLASRFAQEDAESNSPVPERFATGYVASIPPAAAEPTSPERTEPGLPPVEEDFDPAAQPAPAPSSFTDSWSSWIEPAPARPALEPQPGRSRPPRPRLAPEPQPSRSRPPRPRPAPEPQPSRPAAWSTPTPEPQPLRRPAPTAVLERPRTAVRDQITALSARIPGRNSEKSKPRGHRSQQIAAVALIVLVIGVIWILAASCSTPTGGAVQPSPAPVPTTEAAPPPPPVTETPGRMNLLPLCTPFTPKC